MASPVNQHCANCIGTLISYGKSRLSMTTCPMWARGRCWISPPRFLAECCKRQLNQVTFVLLYFRLSAFSDLYWVCLSVFSCTVLFVSISQVIGCEDHLRNDLYCVKWGVKLYSQLQLQLWPPSTDLLSVLLNYKWHIKFRCLLNDCPELLFGTTHIIKTYPR